MTGTTHDVWEVNVEEEYHEEAGPSTTAPAAPRPGGSHGTGRDAPVIRREVLEAHTPLGSAAGTPRGDGAAVQPAGDQEPLTPGPG
jgi:hypothetical protein